MLVLNDVVSVMAAEFYCVGDEPLFCVTELNSFEQIFVIGFRATVNYRANCKLHSDPLPFLSLPVYFSPVLSPDLVEVISVTASVIK